MPSSRPATAALPDNVPPSKINPAEVGSEASIDLAGVEDDAMEGTDYESEYCKSTNTGGGST